LDAAAALFWEKGYASTTTRELAAALHIRQASLYYHVANKEELLYKICVSSLEQFLAEVPPAAAKPIRENGATCPSIQRLIRAHVATLLKSQKRNATMLMELRALSGRRQAHVVELRARYARLVKAVLQAGRDAGEIRADIPVEHLSLALLNMLNWAALWFHPGQALSAEDLAEIFVKIYVSGAVSADLRSSAASRSWKVPAIGGPIPRPRKPLRDNDGATVERLIRAAVALFARQGYAATSTREVAALLGMQKASLYYHIESKEDLLYFICKYSLERIRDDVTAAVAKVEDRLERVRALIGAHIESMLHDHGEHATTLAEMHALSRHRRTQVLALRDAYQDLVRSILEDAQNSGALRCDIEAKYLCLAVLGLMNRVLVWYRRRGALTPAQLGQLLATIFLTGAGPVD
jgi:TetR/AcrR family transcriptional regulator, cholesterol catabolism regulator